MPKVIYVQLDGVPQPARVLADSVKEEKPVTGENAETSLVLRAGGSEVGRFRAYKVVGWWIQEERD